MDFLAPMQAKDVKDLQTYAAYCQQMLGVPIPRRADIPQVRKQIKDLFAQYPNANWQTLVKIALWAKNRHKRFVHLRQLIACWRNALAQGCLPELEPTYADPKLEEEIDHALKIEKDKEWVFSLTRARGNKARQEVFQAWKTARSSSRSLASS